MRNILALLVLCISCGQNGNPSTKATSESTGSDTSAVISNPEEKIFDYPVVNKSWKMGSHENTRLVLKMYKAWDDKSVNDMKALLADSMTMDFPKGLRRAAGKDEMVAILLKKREEYASTSNDIIAAYPLVNTDNNNEWVNVLVYNKWVYKDNVRDSMLFQDNWQIKDGKISYLVSLEQSPSRLQVKKLEKIVKQN